jgi:excinuclease ABC subunit C
MNDSDAKRHPQREKMLAEAKALTTSPGVYLMKTESADVIYVGKAKALKHRVQSYFQPLVHEHPRTELMIQGVSQFEVILTETEDEALVLECTLIKRYKPKFNVRLKDDKHYPYIKIPAQVDFPRLEWTRKVRNDGARYFGPFPSAYSARIVLRLLTEQFRLRDCTDNTFSHRSRACILYQMDQCSAPCVQKITVEQYQKSLADATAVLEGRAEELIQSLTLEMQEAANEERFEDAARIRDQIQSVQIIAQTQSVSQEDQQLDRDVFAFERKDASAHGVVLQVRRGKLLAVRHYDLFNVEAGVSDEQVAYDFLAQHFLLLEDTDPEQTIADPSGIMVRARLVLMRQQPTELDLLERTLGITITLPTNTAEKQLVSVAQTNAKYALEQGGAKEGQHGFSALEEVKAKLNLERLPRRIECFDISNTQGEDSVASRVVFVDGAPEKTLYRRYKIKTVIGADDFKSMREVIERRFSQMDLRKGDEKPDLVIVDGGKGQLAQAEAIFRELNIQGVDLVGLAKARVERNFKSSEVESSMERIFIPNRVNPVKLYPTSAAYKLLTHCRDEAHRFAITYHRSIRDKI